ncbi:MAG TPA: hypothetical protein VGL81_21495 [Polyangiaceae bacterium]|jgi:hypothetical protein
MKTGIALALAVLVPLLACRRGQDGAPGPADAMAAPPKVEAGPGELPAVVASRCHAAGGGAAVASPEDLEVGDAVLFGEGYAVGLVHRTAAGRMAAVALVDRNVTSARVVELGVTLGDASPPRIVARGNGKELLAADYALPKKTDSRELALQVIGPSGEAKPLPSVVQQRDDSLSFDLGPGLVAWDEETTGTAARGVVRVAPIGPDHPGPARDASSSDSDAEMPRVAADGAGYFVLWMARRADPAVAVDASASAALEAIGEPRAYSWLEVVTVDAAGAPTGPTRRLTSTSGHVSAYDVQSLPGDGRPTLLVVARDDGEAVDGSGGVLLRVRVRADGVEPPVAFPGDGLGRGAPSLVEGEAPWLAWIGPHEEMRLLPLDAVGTPVAPPSAEALLDEALPLATLPGGDGRMLVAFPGDPAASFRTVACTR